jgi:hypothetical protein
MAVLEVKIDKGQRGPQKPQLAYFPTVQVLHSPGVSIDTTPGYPTQDARISEIERKLKINFSDGDTIRYKGADHATIKDAVAAVTADKPNWV